MGYPGVVSTYCTLTCYWYLKEEVKDEYVESNGYVKDYNWFYNIKSFCSIFYGMQLWLGQLNDEVQKLLYIS